MDMDPCFQEVVVSEGVGCIQFVCLCSRAVLNECMTPSVGWIGQNVVPRPGDCTTQTEQWSNNHTRLNRADLHLVWTCSFKARPNWLETENTPLLSDLEISATHCKVPN